MMKLPLFLLIFSYAAVTLAVEPVPAAPEKPVAPAPPVELSTTYLRLANVLSITHEPCDLFLNGQPYLTGMTAGFYQEYFALPKTGPYKYTVKSGDRVLGQFEIKVDKDPSFYTAVLIKEKKGITVHLSKDTPEVKKKTEEEVPVITKRLRIYMGGFGFPMELDAGALGKWSVDAVGLVVDVPILAEAPASVSVTYKDKYDTKIVEAYPLDFVASPQNSVFVFQRGLNRPRLRAYPDNTAPVEEEETPAPEAAP
jgi:hypothetical protein